MNLMIQAKGMQLTDAMRIYAQEKIGREAQKFVGRLVSAKIGLTKERGVSLAKACLRVKGKEIALKSHGGDIYASIDLLSDEISRALSRDKQTHSWRMRAREERKKKWAL